MKYKNKNENLISHSLDNSGETMLEMIISIAIFALMMTFMATIFATANSIEASNYDARNDLNKRLSYVSNANISDSSTLSNVNVGGARTITYKVMRGGTAISQGQYYVQSITDKTGGYEKVVISK